MAPAKWSTFPKSPASRKTSSACTISSTSSGRASDRMEESSAPSSPPAFVRSFSIGCALRASCCRPSYLNAPWRSIEHAAGDARKRWVMSLIVLSVCLALAAVAMFTKTDSSQHGAARLAALDHEFAPTAYEETPIDIRKDQRRLSKIPWLN